MQVELTNSNRLLMPRKETRSFQTFTSLKSHQNNFQTSKGQISSTKGRKTSSLSHLLNNYPLRLMNLRRRLTLSLSTLMSLPVLPWASRCTIIWSPSRLKKLTLKRIKKLICTSNKNWLQLNKTKSNYLIKTYSMKKSPNSLKILTRLFKIFRRSKLSPTIPLRPLKCLQTRSILRFKTPRWPILTEPFQKPLMRLPTWPFTAIQSAKWSSLTHLWVDPNILSITTNTKCGCPQTTNSTFRVSFSKNSKITQPVWWKLSDHLSFERDRKSDLNGLDLFLSVIK